LERSRVANAPSRNFQDLTPALTDHLKALLAQKA